jgi:hypothetical protein
MYRCLNKPYRQRRFFLFLVAFYRPVGNYRIGDYGLTYSYNYVYGNST